MPPELRPDGPDGGEGFRDVRRMWGMVLDPWRWDRLAGGIEHVHDGMVVAGADVQDGRSGAGPVEREAGC